jgi:beta-galactosidase
MDQTARLVPTAQNPPLDFTQADTWLDSAARAGIRVIFHVDTLVPHPRALFQDLAARDETVARYRDHEALLFWAAFGEPHGTSLDLTSADAEGFAAWLRKQYASVDELELAWNVYAGGARLVSSFEEAWRAAAPIGGEDDINGVNRAKRSYGAVRDAIRYRTEKAMEIPIEFIRGVRELDPNHDFLVGSHQLFLNQAYLGWDIREWGQLAPLFGTSIHLSWHFEPVDGEVALPVYLQARYTRDVNPWGITSAYETTGGPVQHSGGYGNHMDRGLMRQLIMSYIAAGNDAIAFWTWNGRPGGWEAGEYGLVGLSGKLTEWGAEAGRLATSLLEYADELQEPDTVEQTASHGEPAYRDVVGEPVAGVLLSWDSQAIQTMEPERHDLRPGLSELSSGTKIETSRAWIGASRALAENQIPFRYFHAEQPELLDPDRVPVLIASLVRAIGDRELDTLTEYVRAGGTLIADCTFAYYDQWGRVRVPGEESPQAGLFGAWIEAVHDNRTGDMSFREERVPRYYGTLEITGAHVIAVFGNEAPAATIHPHGEGVAILTAFELGEPSIRSADNAFACFLSERVRVILAAQWWATVPTTYRRRTQSADHYYIINEGPATDCVIRATDRSYTSAAEIVPAHGRTKNVAICDASGVVTCYVGARSATWIRAIGA